MSIQVMDDPRHYGCYIAIDCEQMYYVGQNAQGRIVLVDSVPDFVPPEVSDAVKVHIDPSYVAPDYPLYSV